MKALKGFRDFYPDECARRRYVESVWRHTARGYGFEEYDGPPLEELDLFRRKSGEEIVGQLYHFIDKGGREVALRPEMTPTLARMAAARQRDFRKPIRWFSIPQVFRYEQPQKGRLREHYQFNCDILGEEGLGADTDLAALCIDTLSAFGFGSDDIVVRVSDRQFWIDFLEGRGVPPDDHYRALQAIDKSERQPEETTRAQLGALADPVFQILREGAESARIDEVIGGLAARGLDGYAVRDLSIVRGLAYYTGVVFEVFDRGGKNRAIAAGGRYDSLLGSLCGVDMPALGFGMGDVVLGNLISEHSGAEKRMRDCLQADQGVDVYLVVADESRRGDAMRLARGLRAAGLRAAYPLAPAKVGKQFQSAEQSGASHAVVVGSEWPQVGVKELATRSEERLDASDAPARLCERLAFRLASCGRIPLPLSEN